MEAAWKPADEAVLDEHHGAQLRLITTQPLATVSLQFLSRLSIVSVNFYPRIWGGLLQIRARLHNKMASSSKFTDAYRITLVFSGKVRDS